jgi:hypothetical protein
MPIRVSTLRQPGIPLELLLKRVPPSYEYPIIVPIEAFMIVGGYVDDLPNQQVRGWLGVPLICRDGLGSSPRPRSLASWDDARIAGIFAHQRPISGECPSAANPESAETLHRLLDIGQQITRVTDPPKGCWR